MSTLRELQGDFAHAVLTHAVSALAPHVRGDRQEAQILLYAQTVYGTLTRALEAVYPAMVRLVGAHCFDGLARRFIRVTPSRSGDLHDFGAAFAGFIATTPLTAGYPYLPDVAGLEWKMHRVFHARDALPPDINRLRAIEPERYGTLCFEAAPASDLLAAPYPVQRIWEANQPGRDGCVEIEPEDTRLLLLRRAGSIEVIPLTPGDYAFLDALRAGQTIAVAVERSLDVEPGFDPQAALARAVAIGALTGFTLEHQRGTAS